MSKKLFQILIPFLVIALIISQHAALANSLDISRGVMPDSLFYNLDLQLEKIQLDNSQNNQEKLADLHYQFGTERLNELNYLADEDKANIDQVVTINNNYQDNIQSYSKIIANQNQEENIGKIVPQIQELQAVQNKIVNKINEKPVEDAVKVIVKSSIKESQDSLIQALATVSKPIIINTVETVENSESTNKPQEVKEVTDILDKTITDLKNYQEEVKRDLANEESNLKSKTDTSEIVTGQSETPVTPPVDNTSIESQAVTKIDANSEVIETADIALDDPSTEPVITETSPTSEWYYSSSCDYVSETPGKDPVCGGDLIPVSSLPPDHSFFTKYIFKDGKYVQNIDDLADKETTHLTNQITEIIQEINQEQIPTDTTTSTTVDETPTPIVSDTPPTNF